MPKSPSKHLFELIKSLTREEKKHVKLFAGHRDQRENLIYVQLFDSIEKQEEYDEKKILKTLSSIKHERLPNLKNFLYDFILKALRDINYGSTVAKNLRRQLDYIEFLYNKGLYQHCLNYIEKSKIIAGKYEKDHILLEIAHWEKQILTATIKSPEKKLDDFHSIVEEEAIQLEKVRNLIEYVNLGIEGWLYAFGGELERSPQNTQKLQQLFKTDLLSSEEIALSYEAKLRFYFSKTLLCRALNYDEESFLSRKKILDLMEANPHQIKDQPEKYVQSLNNLLIGQLTLKRNDDFLRTLKKALSIEKTYSADFNDVTRARLLVLRNLELHFYITNRKFAEGIKVLPAIEKGLKTFGEMLTNNQKLLLYYNASYICFGAGNFKEALAWNNKALMKDSGIKTDLLYIPTLLLNLIIHFELNNMDIVEKELNSVYRLMKKDPSVSEKELIIVSHLRKNINKIIDPHERQAIFLKLATYIKSFKQNSKEDEYEYFDYQRWIEEKISR